MRDAGAAGGDAASVAGLGSRDPEAFDRAVDRLTAAAGGLFAISLFEPGAARQLIRAAGRGDGLARCCLETLDSYLCALDATRSRRRGDRCLLCDASRFWRRNRPCILVLIAPDRADADEMLVSGVCDRCAGSAGWPQTGWQERILALMAEPLGCLWPDSRFLDPARLAPAGRA